MKRPARKSASTFRLQSLGRHSDRPRKNFYFAIQKRQLESSDENQGRGEAKTIIRPTDQRENNEAKILLIQFKMKQLEPLDHTRESGDTPSNNFTSPSMKGTKHNI